MSDIFSTSLGGGNAMFLAAFDERGKIAVSSCGWTPFEFYETVPGRLKTWALPTYMPPLETLYKSDHRQFPFDFHEVAADLATNGRSHGHRWRAAVVLAHIANTDKNTLQTTGRNPVAILKTMADQEKHEGVFFVFIDQVHKILNDRNDMIDIFAIAKESKHHPTPPVGNRYRMAETFHSVAVRDKDKTWR